MTAADATSIGRAARWALLFCTLFGLAVMHTVGHTGLGADVHAGPAMASQSMTATPGSAVWAFAEAAVDPCSGDHCDGHGGHGAISGWSICLAILGGLAVIVLLTVMLMLALGGHRRTRDADMLRFRSPRAPPGRTAGLTIASAAVLRI